ncbi:musculin isoform X2 [Spea bombifrons]|uniref:musculin isoform X2 n=1 Tax=Spea bombifrons TaxID=233779 RepID=UPI0023492B91|nr:musculin isoform X2 [Spea bombifrons]
MSTGSVSDTEDLLELRVLELQYPKAKRSGCGKLLLDHSTDISDEEGVSQSSNGKRKRVCRSQQSPDKKQPVRSSKECKQSQRNAANARERARMRVLSKAFSRLKTSLPWVPPDTKLSKLDTLRLASSYIAHLRQLLQEDRYDNSFVHPVNLVRMKLPYSQHQSASRAAT